MSDFRGHEPCPQCRKAGQDKSGNNMGVWDDHKYCFACGYLEKDNSLIVKKFMDNKKSQDVSAVTLPDDCSIVLPERCIAWLDKYGLTKDEKDQFVWSEKYQRLIYPVYDAYDNLTYYQGRTFANDGYKHPKYHTEGPAHKIYHTLGAYSPRIIVVEDVVSALKVARHGHVMPLWGSQIGPERIKTLSSLFFKLWIWLDKDKAEYSLKTRPIASPHFDEVRCIVTENDPKDYDDDQIRTILNG